MRTVILRLSVQVEITILTGTDDEAIDGVVDDLEALCEMPTGSRKVRLVVDDVETVSEVSS